MILDYKKHYHDVLRPKMMKDFGYDNIFQVPRLEKIVVNMGLGRRAQDKAVLKTATEGMAAITGQAPLCTYARKSVAGFKIREGMPLGLKVTLRKAHMYEFLQRLIVVAMPRLRDFRGLSARSFDGHGNFSLGIKEYHVFPEIRYDKISDIFGIDICIVTTAANDTDARRLLEGLELPFRT